MALVLLAAGCGSTGEGEWEGDARLQSEGDAILDMSIDLEEGGDEPSGTIRVGEDERVITFQIVSGTIDDGVQLTGTGPSEWQIELDGEIDGSTMTGSIYSPEFEDSGAFELEKQ